MFFLHLKELQQKMEQQEKKLILKDEEIAAIKKKNSFETPQQLQVTNML